MWKWQWSCVEVHLHKGLGLCLDLDVGFGVGVDRGLYWFSLTKPTLELWLNPTAFPHSNWESWVRRLQLSVVLLDEIAVQPPPPRPPRG